MIAPIESLSEPRSRANHGSRRAALRENVNKYSTADPNGSSGNFINDSVGRYPVAAVVSSVVVGLTLGWFIKRKWNV